MAIIKCKMCGVTSITTYCVEHLSGTNQVDNRSVI